MKTLGPHLRVVLFRLATLFRVVLLWVCIICGLWRIFTLVNKGVESAKWLSPDMVREYAVIIGIVIAIIFLIAIKEELNSRLEISQGEIAFAQSIRRERSIEKQLNAELTRRIDLLSSESINEVAGCDRKPVREFLVQKTSPNPKEELSALIGMGAVKTQIEKIEAKLSYEKILNGKNEKTSLHMRFVGGPGTGKTTVGRIMAGLLFQAKQIPKDKYVEINGNDLVGKYMGETPLVVKEAFRQAAGGVLFIDEVYALAGSAQAYSGGSYRNEAVTQLLTLLENNPDGTVVIVAGYRREMEQFFEMNPGLPSRIPTVIEFPDYTPLELLEIAQRMLKNLGHTLTRDAAKQLYGVIHIKIQRCQASQKPFGNARYIRNVVAELHQEHALNYQRKLVEGHAICLADVNQEVLLKLD